MEIMSCGVRLVKVWFGGVWESVLGFFPRSDFIYSRMAIYPPSKSQSVSWSHCSIVTKPSNFNQAKKLMRSTHTISTWTPTARKVMACWASGPAIWTKASKLSKSVESNSLRTPNAILSPKLLGPTVHTWKFQKVRGT